MRIPASARSVSSFVLREAIWMGKRLAILGAIAAAVVVVLAYASEAGAQPVPTTGALNSIVDLFDGTVRRFEAALIARATELFLALAGIQMIVAVTRQVRIGGDIYDIIGVVLWEMVVLGTFYWFLVNTPDFMRAVIQSFAQLGNEAVTSAGGSANLSPSDVFNAGISVAKTMWNGLTWRDVPLSILLALAGLVEVWVYAQICAMMIEVMVEGYIAASTCVILMGFGGSVWTRDIAIAQFRYAISVGMKRLMLQILVGLGQVIITGWAEALQRSTATPDYITIATMIGAPLVLLRLVQTLPQRAQDSLTGIHSGQGGGSLARTAGAMAAAGGAAATAAAGGGAAVAGAFRQSSAAVAAQVASGNGPAGGAVGRAAAITGGAVGNLGRSFASDMGQRLAGNYAASHGSTPWRMAQGMNAAASETRAATAAGSGQQGGGRALGGPQSNSQTSGNSGAGGAGPSGGTP